MPEPVRRVFSRASSRPSNVYDPTSLPNGAIPNALTLASFLVLIAACGFPRPERLPDSMDTPDAQASRSCAAGACTDPAYPFCDTGGEIGGTPMTCVAVTCTPGEFAACRGSAAEFACNSTATGYELVQCAKGCDSATGCHLCEPDQTVCTNGKVQTCDASGAVTSSESCALGCFEDLPRCRDINPSNSLAMYLDMTDTPPDLDLSKGGTIDTSTGMITTTDGIISVPSYVTTDSADGVAIRVFVAGRVRLGDVHIRTNGDHLGSALAIVSTSDITIGGAVTIQGGDLLAPTCVGGRAAVDGTSDQTSTSYDSGAGGGGHATNGGSGGAATGDPSGVLLGGSTGVAAGSPTLVPLRGGCAGGGIVDNSIQVLAYGARGGGAAQFSSRTAIRIDGALDASGQAGYDLQTPNGGATTGGGGGGALLLEAPSVTLGPAAALLTKGGDGGSPCSPSECGANYGRGGHGSTASLPGGNGADGIYGAGGGGGGLGRIRINTQDGTYRKSATTSEIGALTTGQLLTR
jgi:hypothetical protein